MARTTCWMACGLVGLLSGLGGCSDSPAAPGLQGQVRLTLLHTADIHSRLLPYNLQLSQVDSGLGLGQAGSIVNVGGAARMSHIIGRERARSQRALHLDGGDCFQGAPIFNFFKGEAEIKTLTAMGTDAMVVANHEFDLGALNLGIQVRNHATFPTLAANYRFVDPEDPGASPLGTFMQPFSTFDVDGLTVGVIGMGNLSTITSIFDMPNRHGITPLQTTEVAQFYVDLLRPSVDVLVVVTHLGLEYDQEMIEKTTGIDVVLGGHNHIVLQPPKKVLDCQGYEEDTGRNFIELDAPEGTNPGDPGPKVRRYCTPRNVILAHSGAFAKYVGRLDLVVSNVPEDLTDPDHYDPNDGFEVASHSYELFPVTSQVPEDPIVARVLEPYRQGLDVLENLELIVGYARDGSRRYASTGGDSALGNIVAASMWLRPGVQTDFSLTNSTGIRSDLVPGPLTIEQMYNIFPFDNSIAKMQLSGVEVQQLFDFVARRTASRGCVSQAQIAGARLVIDCSTQPTGVAGVASDIYIGVRPSTCSTSADCEGAAPCNGGRCVCESDAQCPGNGLNSCDVNTGYCWQPLEQTSTYELATNNYLAQGGSGYRVLQRNTTQSDTKVQQRDAVIDYIRNVGRPCGWQGSSAEGSLAECSVDTDCSAVGEGFICACPENAVEPEGDGVQCTSDEGVPCQKGACILASCRNDVAKTLRETCDGSDDVTVQARCSASLSPCKSAGEQCKFLSCVDRRVGNFTDNRILGIGQ